MARGLRDSQIAWGTKARETEIGIQVEIQGGAPPIKGMPLGARSL